MGSHQQGAREEWALNLSPATRVSKAGIPALLTIQASFMRQSALHPSKSFMEGNEMAKVSMIRWLALGMALALGAPASAQQAPIKIGELNSYARWAAFTVPYRNGWQLALDEINAKGGVLGRKIEIISREDGATTGDATRVADELVTREGVSLLFGSFLSNVGVAMADYANQKKIVYVAAEPLTDAITMAQGNRYTFRVRPSNYMQVGMLVEQAKASGAKRWAIVAPNYEYGQSAAQVFKRLIQERVPGAEIVAEQYPALGKIEAGATVSALEQAKPDGIFNVLFGPDLTQFVREGNTRGLFEDKSILSLLTGEPEWLLPLKDEVPEGWTVTGYPWDEITEPKHKAFVDAYRAKFNETPRLGSLLGYMVVYMIRDTIERAGSAESDALVKAFQDAKFDTVIGPVTMRGIDHQASMGAWVGKLVLKGATGGMTDWKYHDGTSFLPTEAEVKAARKE
jgi:branched-chain amino acid transport system substrate-binding protein